MINERHVNCFSRSNQFKLRLFCFQQDTLRRFTTTGKKLRALLFQGFENLNNKRRYLLAELLFVAHFVLITSLFGLSSVNDLDEVKIFSYLRFFTCGEKHRHFFIRKLNSTKSLI